MLVVVATAAAAAAMEAVNVVNGIATDFVGYHSVPKFLRNN